MIAQYLDNMLALYETQGFGTGMYGQLKKYGRHFTPMERNGRINKMTDKECFSNCVKAMEIIPDTIYCEGLALSPTIPIPLHHAWLVTADGCVLDTTWREAGAEYFGIPFAMSYLYKVLVKSGLYGVMDNYKFRQFLEHDASDFLYTGVIADARIHKETAK